MTEMKLGTGNPSSREKKEKAYQTANDGAHIEDCPEPSKVSSLLFLPRVGEHDGSLGSPQQTSADTEKSTGEDVEASHARMDRDQQADCVYAISNTSKCQGQLNTQSVDESSTKETEDGESTIQGGILKSKVISFQLKYLIRGSRALPCCLQACDPSFLHLQGHRER